MFFRSSRFRTSRYTPPRTPPTATSELRRPEKRIDTEGNPATYDHCHSISGHMHVARNAFGPEVEHHAYFSRRRVNSEDASVSPSRVEDLILCGAGGDTGGELRSRYHGGRGA